MTPVEAFECWAPPGAVWSDWAKPVLFAQPLGGLALRMLPPPEPSPLPWLDRLPGRAALVLELPGDRAVATGFALARRGYRPVPLFNSTHGPAAVIDHSPVLSRLLGWSAELHRLALPDDAPPVFLLDAARLRGQHGVTAGRFDNRWIVFPQDFPSAAILGAHGITEVVLWQEAFTPPADDLAHVLRRWQDSGLRIWLHAETPPEHEVERLTVQRPPWYRSWWQRLMVGTGLQRNSAGGFGATIPVPSDWSGGGGFG